MFPWILWHLWKARNVWVFEKISFHSSAIFSKIWLHVNTSESNNRGSNILPLSEVSTWINPLEDYLKCGASWINNRVNCGASWLVRNHQGHALYHIRRSYSQVDTKLESELQSLLWATESLTNLHLKKVLFECSSETLKEAILHPQHFLLFRHLTAPILHLLNSFEYWSLMHVPESGNRCASSIALSVTKEHRYQSYIARDGRVWLHALMLVDFANVHGSR